MEKILAQCDEQLSLHIREELPPQTKTFQEQELVHLLPLQNDIELVPAHCVSLPNARHLPIRVRGALRVLVWV